MEKLLAILCLAGFVAAGVLVDSSRHSLQGGIIKNGEVSLTRDQILLQQFILQLLSDVESVSLQNQELLELNKDCRVQDNMYLGQIDDNMRLVMNKIQGSRDVSTNNLLKENNEQSRRQMAGLYLLLVQSRNLDVLQTTALCARLSLQPTLFVNALILALSDRHDTQMLLRPALYEILPRLYEDESLLEKVDATLQQQRKANNASSIRQKIQNILLLKEQTRAMKLQTKQEESMENNNRAEIWMPWREMHRQLAAQGPNGKARVFKMIRDEDPIVLQSSRNEALLKDDVGLKASLNLLIDELILKEVILRQTLNSHVQNVPILSDRRPNLQKEEVGVSGRLQNTLNRIDNRNSIRLQFDSNERQINRGYSDEFDWLNAHANDGNVLGSANTGRGITARSTVNAKERVDNRRKLNKNTSGQLLLNLLQQIVARLDIEDISIRSKINNLNDNRRILQQSNRIRNDPTNGLRFDDTQRQVVLNKINEISDRLNGSLQKLVQQISSIDQNQKEGQLSQEIDHIVLLEILNEVESLCEYVPNGQVSSILEDPTTQLLLRHIVSALDEQLRRIQSERNTRSIGLNSVRINNVDIDRLQTYLEYSDVDLSNINLPIGENNKRQIVGRIPRLNHQPFNIHLDINSELDQLVVIRSLLVPTQDAPMEGLQNIILLDIAKVALKTGRNQIVRRSRDISWTGRDVTPFTEMVNLVENDLPSDKAISQNSLFPHRLLLPRGRSEGLRMQLVVVVTPAEESNSEIRTASMALDNIALDILPLTYPLDKNINDLNAIISLSNLQKKDVIIYHNEQI